MTTHTRDALLATPEQQRYTTHARAFGRVPYQARWTGHIGLGAIPKEDNLVDLGRHVFVPYDDLRFVAMTHTPGNRNKVTGKNGRMTYLLRPSQRHGAPALHAEDAEHTWDDALRPYDRLNIETEDGVRELVAGVGSLKRQLTLNSGRHERVFVLANRIRETLIAAAYRRRQAWLPPEDFDVTYRWGDLDVGHRALPRFQEDFLPVPYVNLNEDWAADNLGRELVPDRAIRKHFILDLRRDLPVVSPVNGVFQGYVSDPGWRTVPLFGLERKKMRFASIRTKGGRQHFIAMFKKHSSIHRDVGAPVRVGEEIGHHVSMPKPWKMVKGIDNQFYGLDRFRFGDCMVRFLMASWVLGQARYVRGRRIVPFAAVSNIAVRLSQEDFDLVEWDISDEGRLDCLNVDAQAYVYPPLSQRYWGDLCLELGFGIALNLLPSPHYVNVNKGYKPRKHSRQTSSN